MPTFVKHVENNRVLIQVAAAVEADGSQLDRRFAALVDPGALGTGDEPQVDLDVFEAADRALGATVYETDDEAF